jgi:hypothetical protein
MGEMIEETAQREAAGGAGEAKSRLRFSPRLLLRIAIAAGSLIGLAMAATPQSAWVGHLPGFAQRPAEPTPNTETAEVRRVRRARAIVAPRRVRLVPPRPRVPRLLRQPSAPPAPSLWVISDPPIARGPPSASL